MDAVGERRAAADPFAADGVRRVVVAQLASSLDPAANRDLVSRVAAEATALAPDLLVLPEATMHDFGSPGVDLGAVAEPVDGPFVHAVAAAAASTGAVVVAGMFEGGAGGAAGSRPRRQGVGDNRPYNTVVAVGPDGRLLARYRKLHLYDAFDYRESERLLAGEADPPVFDLGGIRVGIMTCYDLRFPEVARLLVDAGAGVLVVPAAWVAGEQKTQQWQALLVARAIENTAYVIGAAQPPPRYSGASAVVDPLGRVLASARQEPGLISAELDPHLLTTVRARNPSLANRRFTVARR